MTHIADLLTPRQVSERLKAAGMPTSDETVRQWIRKGYITAIASPGGRVFIKSELVDAILRGDFAPGASEQTEEGAA